MKSLKGSVLSRFVFGLGSVCLMADVALAKYEPPKQVSPKKSNNPIAWVRAKLIKPIWGTSTTGTRGSCSTQPSVLDFVAIAPSSDAQGHVGVSSSTRPSFVWLVLDEQPMEMDFLLAELTTGEGGEVKQKTIFRQELTSQPGWMSFQLSNTAPALSEDKHYVWKAVFYCRTRRQPSAAKVITAELSVQPVSAEGLEIGQSSVERAEFWAEAGFWYDAIAAVADQDDAAAQRKRQSLLSDLIEYEQDLEPDSEAQKQLERLQNLAPQP